MAIEKDDAVNNVEEKMAEVPSKSPPAGRDEAKLGMKKSLQRFIREVRVELKKTIWPTRDELTKYVTVVVITIVAVAVFLYISDVVSAQIMKIVGITHATGK